MVFPELKCFSSAHPASPCPDVSDYPFFSISGLFGTPSFERILKRCIRRFWTCFGLKSPLFFAVVLNNLYGLNFLFHRLVKITFPPSQVFFSLISKLPWILYDPPERKTSSCFEDPESLLLSFSTSSQKRPHPLPRLRLFPHRSSERFFFHESLSDLASARL